MISLRRPKATAHSSEPAVEDTPDSSVASPVVGRTQSWTGGPARGARVVLYLMIAGVLLGPLGFVLAWQATQRADAVVEQLQAGGAGEAAPDAGLYWDASHTAEQVVQAWLGATRDDHTLLDQLVPGSSTERLPDTATDYSSVATVSVEQSQSQPGLWQVVVSATLNLTLAETEDQDPTPAPVQSRQFFLVPVLVDPDTGMAAALTLPSVVGDPEQHTAPGTALTYALPPSSEIPTTVGQFLAALLTGSGDVSRYLTPSVDVDLPADVGYTAVTVYDVRTAVPADELADPAEGAATSVLALVELTRLDGARVSAAYALDLTSRDGRWEITAITTPPLADTD